MSVSVNQFLSDLYDEHIEEAVFLYELVLGSVRESDFQWLEAHDFEVRREAHIDALVIGNAEALERCKNVAGNGAAELYVYASIILRQDRTGEFAERIFDLELSDYQSLIALTAAIAEHSKVAQLEKLSTRNLDACCSVTLVAVKRANEQLKGVKAIGALDQALLARVGSINNVQSEAVQVESDSDRPDNVELLATVSGKAFSKVQMQGIRSEDDLVKIESIINIQRFGQSSDKAEVRSQIKFTDSGHAAIMIGANRSYVQPLIKHSESALSEDLIMALGLSGLLEALRPLARALESDFSETAATALYCITGAELYENVFDEEEIAEDELFEDERDAFKAGKKPTRLDGEAFGEERSRISVDPERWKHWFAENRARFDSGTRYRTGEPITPDSLVRTLRRDQSPLWIREYTEKELRLRYGVSAPFNVSLTVGQQMRSLLAMRQSVSSLQGFSPGRWYLGGQLMGHGN